MAAHIENCHVVCFKSIRPHCLTFLGSGLKCCSGNTSENCNSVNCTSATVDRCFTTTIIYQNGTKVSHGGCANAFLCKTGHLVCDTLQKIVKSCESKFCSTDNCNKPIRKKRSGGCAGSGAAVTKFTLALIASFCLVPT